MTNNLNLHPPESYVTISLDSPAGGSPAIPDAFPDPSTVQMVVEEALDRAPDTSTTRSIFQKTIEDITIKKPDVKYVRSALKLHYLLLVPVLGWIAFAIVQICIKYSFASYTPNEDVKTLVGKIHKVHSGLSDERVKKLAYFILERKEKHVQGETSYHYQSQLFGMAGILPRDVIELPDGRFVIKVYSRILATDDATFHRGILIDINDFSQCKTTLVHIKESDEKIEILDPSAPHALDGIGPKPVDCFIINNRSDLSLLYPDVLTPTSLDREEYIDIAFHAQHKRGSFLDHVVSIGQNLGSKGTVNRGIVHVDMIHGRVRQEITDEPDPSKRTRDLLMIYSATGTAGTFTEYAKNPKDLKNGQEIQVFRFRKKDAGTLQAMFQFAQRQVNKRHLPRAQITSKELSTINPIDVYHPSYTPGLYSNLDAGLCPFSSIQYGKAARKRIAEAVADELLGQARQSDNQLLGGICSAFTSLTLQVGLLLGLLTPEDKKLLIEKSIQRASNELTPKACALKTQITEKFGFLPSDKRVTDPKFDDHINESLGILCEAATQARQNGNQSLLEAVNKYKTRVLRLRNYNLQKAIKNHLYSYLKNLLQAAEKPDLPPESLQGRVATLVKDPLFRLYSRFIMPSTLQGILVRHKTATVQIVPPGQPTLPLTSI